MDEISSASYEDFLKNVKPVPHATASGAQEGVIPPGKRKYVPGTHKVVDNAQATLNMIARKEGRMALIEHGSDQQTNMVKTPVMRTPSIPPKQYPDLSKAIEKDSDWGPKPSSEFDLTDDDGVIDIDRPEFPSVPEPNARNPYTEPKEYGHYMPTSIVTMEIRQEHQDGTYSTLITVGLPVCKVVQNSVSVTLVSPIQNGQYTFQPSPGSDIILNGAGLDNTHVFFPGTAFTLEDWKISGMSFVKAR